MTEIDYYEIVRQKLTLGPLYAPKHKKTTELLKVFWNEEEIRILSHFKGTEKDITIRELEERSGVPKDRIKEILEKCREKGTIGKRGSRYCLLPILPGIFEKYFIRLKDTEENLKSAAEIYRFLFKNFIRNKF